MILNVFVNNPRLIYNFKNNIKLSGNEFKKELCVDLLQIMSSVRSDHNMIELELGKNNIKDIREKCVYCYTHLSKNFSLSREEMQNKRLKTKTHCPGCGDNKQMCKNCYILIHTKTNLLYFILKLKIFNYVNI